MTNRSPLNNKLEMKTSTLDPLLAQKLQFFEKSLRAVTSNSVLTQQRNKEALRQIVLALETPNLVDSHVFGQQYRFKSALKRETARIVNSSINSGRVFECGKPTDNVDYDRKIRESIAFDFGDDYGNNTNLDDEFFYDTLDCYQTDNLVCDNLCLIEIEDINYSRVEIFRLSSLTKEDLEFF